MLHGVARVWGERHAMGSVHSSRDCHPRAPMAVVPQNSTGSGYMKYVSPTVVNGKALVAVVNGVVVYQLP